MSQKLLPDSHDQASQASQDGQGCRSQGKAPGSKQDSLPQNRSPSPRPGRRTRPAGWRRAAGQQLKKCNIRHKKNIKYLYHMKCIFVKEETALGFILIFGYF